MRERAKRITLSNEVRKQVKHEQACRCMLCQSQFKETDLYIHHVKPVSQFKKGEGHIANKRENLCALCGSCHSYADHMALEKQVYLDEIIDMIPNVEYSLLKLNRG